MAMTVLQDSLVVPHQSLTLDPQELLAVEIQMSVPLLTEQIEIKSHGIVTILTS